MPKATACREPSTLGPDKLSASRRVPGSPGNVSQAGTAMSEPFTMGLTSGAPAASTAAVPTKGMRAHAPPISFGEQA